MASFPAGKSVEELEAGFDSTPLFMSNLPENHDENPALAALQSLVYSDDPVETASNFKNQGNDWYTTRPATKSTKRQALTYYTKGIAVASTDSDLNATLYSNRAAVHLDLQNYASALSDCKQALLLNPKLVKAWYRAGKACIAIEKPEQALDCIHRGLKVYIL